MATSTTRLDWDEAAAPATPAASKVRVYAKADGLMYSKDDAGAETLMSSGVSSGIAATIVDAKGDLIAATAADTVSRLAVGTVDGDVLNVSAAAATGLAYRRHLFCYKPAGGDQATSLMTYIDSTSLSFAIAASKVYKFRFVVFFTTNATTVGIKLAINGPASAVCYAGAYVPVAAPAAGGSALAHNVAASGDISTDMAVLEATAGPGTAPTMAILEGLVVNSTNAGTLKLRHASETATATTIKELSHGELWEVA